MGRPKGRQSADVARQTKRSILEAAGRHFAAQGFKATSVRDIAADAGATHGLIRHHFGSKDELWRAVVKNFAEQVAASQLPLLQKIDASDPLALMKGLAEAFIRQTAAMPQVARLILLDCAEPGPRLDFLVENIMPLHLAVGPIFDRVREAGHLEHHDHDSFFIFLVVLGGVPLALPDFANRFQSRDIRTEPGIEAHVRRVLITLFGNDGRP